MRQSIFTVLEKWCPHAQENFLTEALSIVLRENPGLAAVLFKKWASKCDFDSKKLKVSTQEKHGPNIIDLIIEDEKNCILIEAKWEARPTPGQLKKYEEDFNRRYSDNLKNKKILFLYRHYPLRPEDSHFKQVYWPTLSSEITNRCKTLELDNPYLVEQFQSYLEEKHMVAFKGLSSIKKIKGIKEMKSFIQDCRSLDEQLFSQLRDSGFNVDRKKTEENFISDNTLAGWYFDITPNRWKKYNKYIRWDPSLWCGFYIYGDENTQEVEQVMYLWAAIYWKHNSDKKSKIIYDKMREKCHDVFKDKDYPNYRGASYDENCKDILHNDPEQFVQSSARRLKGMLARIEKIWEKLPK